MSFQTKRKQIDGAYFPSSKKQKSNNSINLTQQVVIFGVPDIVRVTLDFLEFRSSLSVAINIADDQYCHQRFGLSVKDIEAVEKYLEKVQLDWDHAKMAIFFGTFRRLFGDVLFSKLLQCKFYYGGYVDLKLDHLTIRKTQMNTRHAYDHDEYYIGEMQIEMENDFEIETFFNCKQNAFLKKNNIIFPTSTQMIWIREVCEFFEVLGADAEQKEWEDKYVIFPKCDMYNNHTTKHFSISSLFGFTVNPVNIEMLPIFMDNTVNPVFKTHTLDESPPRIVWICPNDDTNGDQEIQVFLNHQSTKLERIWLYGDTDSFFVKTININCPMSLSNKTRVQLVPTANPRCQLKWMGWTDKIHINKCELNFIQKTKGTGMDCANLVYQLGNLNNIEFNTPIVENGVVSCTVGGVYDDIYYFKPIKNKLILTGCNIAHFEENKKILIKTSDIPHNWTIFGIGGTVNIFEAVAGNNKNKNNQISILLDNFPSNIEQFEITQRNINIIQPLSWEKIPKSMKSFTFSTYNFNQAVNGLCPFFVNKKSNSSDLEYKQVEFIFCETLYYNHQQIDESDLTNILNPLFTSGRAMPAKSEITIFRRY